MREDIIIAQELEAMRNVHGMDTAQALLKANGFILLAFGPRKVTFYPEDTKMTDRGRIPREAIITQTGVQYQEFAKTLKKPAKKTSK